MKTIENNEMYQHNLIFVHRALNITWIGGLFRTLATVSVKKIIHHLTLFIHYLLSLYIQCTDLLLFLYAIYS